MPDALARAIALLTDGQPVNWESVLEEAADPAERALIEELRGLAQFDAENGETQPASSTIAMSAPRSGTAARRWGHLELLEEIGRGGYGTVYRAWDTRLAREVALKMFSGDDGGSNIDEARRLARVIHPNIVGIFGADRIQGQFGLWMELLQGPPLDAIIRHHGPFSAREAVAIALDICGAVAAIHRAGLIHRDIKAQNVIRERGGRHVLMDLGASLDATHEDVDIAALAGTPLYMAPELFEGRMATVASDIYAIGVLLYRLVTGEFPIQAETVGDVRRAHQAMAMRPLREVRPELPPAFVEIVECCLAHAPGSRFRSVATLERALQNVDRGAPGRSATGKRSMMWAAAALGTAIPVVVAWAFAVGYLPAGSSARSAAGTVSPDQYTLLAAYEELAFEKRLGDPAGAGAAARAALSQIQTTLGGNRPIFGTLYARMANSSRHAGNMQQASTDALDAATNVLLSVGEDHPYTAVVAMELARNAQAIGDHRTAAEQLARALAIRQRVLGLAELGAPLARTLDLDTLERSSRSGSGEADSDGDGLLDWVEAAIGLDPHSSDTDRDKIRDDDEVSEGAAVSNRLRVGLMASPYLTWAHYGAHPPRDAGWQSPARFPMVERPESAPPRWTIAATQKQTYFHQRLSRAQSARALAAGFSLLIRARPIAGTTSFVVDTAPVGPRFDVASQRIDNRSIEVRLLSSVIPPEGQPLVFDVPVNGRDPILELRYRPEGQAAALYIDGRLASPWYDGHRQFQDPLEGAVSWGVTVAGSTSANAAAAFTLVWLEIF